MEVQRDTSDKFMYFIDIIQRKISPMYEMNAFIADKDLPEEF